jgi:hypothetical protein
VLNGGGFCKAVEPFFESDGKEVTFENVSMKLVDRLLCSRWAFK